MSRRSHGNALEPGYRLREYRIESVLGQGGFGITYRAYDTTLERPVAIKEYLPVELAVRESDSTVRPFTEDRASMFAWGLSRFLDEARTLARLKHPNLVQVYAVLEENATAYMVMPFEEGRSLADLMNFGKLKDQAQVLAITHALLDGLEHVHEAGFLHRDIKPDNIFVREDGSPVLIDFGSARVSMGTQARSRMTSVVSPGYAPYEQYHGDASRQGPWTDIYGLAATLYAVVCSGRPPMDSLVRGDARIEERPDPHDPAVKAARGEWSPQFLAAIDAALGFRPDERPQSVAQWRAMLPAPGALPTAPAASPSAGTTPRTVSMPPRSGDTTVAAPPLDGRGTARGEAPRRSSMPLVLVAAGALAVIAGAGAWYALSTPGADPGVGDPAVAQPGNDARRQDEATAVRKPAEPERTVAEQRAVDEQARLQAETEAARQRAAEEQARQQAEAEADAARQRAAEEQARLQAEAEAEAAKRAEQERLAVEQARAREAAQRAAEEQARLQAEAEAARQRAEQERLAAEQARAREAAQRAAEEQARLQAEAEAARQRAEQERLAAEQARAREAAHLQALLDGAAADVRALRLTSPAGDNAVEKYRAALDMDPGNATATAGLDTVVERYVGLAERAAADGDLDRAEGFLARGDAVVPGATSVAQGRAALARLRADAAQVTQEKQAVAARDAARPPAEVSTEAARDQASVIEKLQRELAAVKAEQARANRALEQASQASTATAPAPPVPTLAVLPTKIGLDPWGHCYQVLPDVTETIRRELDRTLGTERHALVQDAPDRLWNESGISPQPAAEQVRRFLLARNRSAVLMAVAHCASSSSRRRVSLFLLSADGRADASREGRISELARMVEDLAGAAPLAP